MSRQVKPTSPNGPPRNGCACSCHKARTIVKHIVDCCSVTAESTKPSRGKGRQRDGADEIAERLFDMVRDAEPDEKVVDAIAAELRKAAQGPRKWGVLR